MSIYISGVEMPPVGKCKTITIFDNGSVVKAHSSETLGKAIPVPEHGRTIDADAAKELMKPVDSIREYEPEWTWGELYESNCNILDSLPTIIPASGGKEYERK